MPVDERDLEDARRRLYRLAPEEFLDARTALAATTTDPPLASAIGKLRKPTVAAWVVNAYVAESPDTVDTLLELGRALAQAQADLDTAAMRELSLQRRSTAAELAGAALSLCGRGEAGMTLRQEVTATFDAAIADPAIAARLGVLQRPEQWSGFGVVPTGAAGLTLVPNAEDDQSPAEHAVGSADDPDDADLAQARAALEDADREVEQASSAEAELASRMRRLTTRLSTLQNEIAAVHEDLDSARSDTAEATRARRAAQRSLDRLQQGRH